MTDSAQSLRPDSATSGQPAPPAGEDQAVTNLVLDQALEHIVAVLDDLRFVAERHAQAAPVSSQHVNSLIGLIAMDTLLWIENWPT